MKSQIKLRFSDFKNIIAILPIVVIVIVIFFLLVRNEIIGMSKERLTLIAEEYTDNISGWAQTLLEEMDVYRRIVEKEGGMDEYARKFLTTSSGKHAECPYGIYWGDKYGNYYDASGWKPDADFVPYERQWYIEGLNHVFFEMGEPYIDRMTGKACVSATVRMFFDRVESVMAVDVYLDYVSAVVDTLTANNLDYAFLVTRKSRIIVADTNASMIIQKLGETDLSLNRTIDELIDRHFLGQTVIKADDETYYVNISRIEGTDWLFVACMKQSEMTQKLVQAEWIMTFIGIIICAALILLTLVVSRRMNVVDRKSKTDALTGLLNRDGLRGIVVEAMEANSSQGILVIMDMDNFKRINDELGHPEGDEVLKSFADMLMEFFNRNKDCAARIGGDEFAVFMGRQITNEDIDVMLGKFIRLFHKTYDEKYGNQKLSVSIGVAFVKDCFGNYGELYRCADKALYTAKQNGKDCYAVR